MSLCDVSSVASLVRLPGLPRQRGEQGSQPHDIGIPIRVARKLAKLFQRFGLEVGLARLPEQPGDEHRFRSSGFRRIGFDGGKHNFPNLQLGDDRTHASWNSAVCGASAPVGHPAHGRYEFIRAGLLACGSVRLSCLPGTFRRQWRGRQQLAAYSCGGSAGLDVPFGAFAPASLLASGSKTTRKNPDGANRPDDNGPVNVAPGAVDRNWPAAGTPSSLPRSAPVHRRLSRCHRIFRFFRLSPWSYTSCPAVLLQPPVFAAKKCCFHAPRDHDAHLRVA